jgi:hypothetical protein
MPAVKNHNATSGVPNTTGPHIGNQFSEVPPFFEERNYTIAGVSKDSTGAALGGCTVKLFNSTTDIMEQITISDGSGNYSFNVDKTQQYYAVFYKAGGTPVAGTTLNTLAGA